MTIIVFQIQIQSHIKGLRFYLCTEVPYLAVKKKWNRSIVTESNIFFL